MHNNTNTEIMVANLNLLHKFNSLLRFRKFMGWESRRKGVGGQSKFKNLNSLYKTNKLMTYLYNG